MILVKLRLLNKEVQGMKSRKGFTLIELMIVVAIIGILAAIAIPRFAQLIDKAREAGAKGNLGALRSATAIYYGDNKGQWPKTLNDVTFETNGEKFPAFIPGYMTKIPKATLRRSATNNATNTVAYQTTAPNKETVVADTVTTGGWVYSRNSGDIRINSGQHDTSKDTDPNSTMRYYMYGHEE